MFAAAKFVISIRSSQGRRAICVGVLFLEIIVVGSLVLKNDIAVGDTTISRVGHCAYEAGGLYPRA